MAVLHTLSAYRSDDVERRVYYAMFYAEKAFEIMREKLERLFPQCAPCGTVKTDILVLPRVSRRAVDRYMLRFTFACRPVDIPPALQGMLELHDYRCLLDGVPSLPWYGPPRYTPEDPLFPADAPKPPQALFPDKRTHEEICTAIFTHFLAAGRIEYGDIAQRMAVEQGVPPHVAARRYKMFFRRHVGLAAP